MLIDIVMFVGDVVFVVGFGSVWCLNSGFIEYYGFVFMCLCLCMMVVYIEDGFMFMLGYWLLFVW